MKSTTLAALAVLAMAGSVQAQPADISGTYVSESGETRVRVAKCGAVYCGTIVAVQGEPKDVNNPDPALRSRNLVGILMISNIQPSGDGWSGSLYNYKDGRTYTGRMRMKGSALELSGCVLGGLICRSQTWSRAG